MQVKPRGAETSLVLVKGFADWSPEKVGGLQSMTFWSEDANATADELRQAGIAITQDPTPRPWGITRSASRPRRQ